MNNSFIHDTAIVEKSAKIGDNCKIWHWVHIDSNSKIGDNCILGQNVYVGNDVIIGNNVKLQNNVSVFKGVKLEDDVFCGPSVVFTNVINPRSHVNRRNDFKDTLIKKGATLGANSTIICGVDIGNFAFVAAGACVTKNVKNYSLVAGVPAKQIGWMSEYGEKIPLPLEGKGIFNCPNSSDTYILTNDKLTKK